MIRVRVRAFELASSVPHDQPTTPLSRRHAMGCRVGVIKGQNVEFQHLNWNGWMKRIHADEIKQSTQIDFLPVIEGDPNEYHAKGVHQALRRSSNQSDL